MDSVIKVAQDILTGYQIPASFVVVVVGALFALFKWLLNSKEKDFDRIDTSQQDQISTLLELLKEKDARIKHLEELIYKENKGK